MAVGSYEFCKWRGSGLSYAKACILCGRSAKFRDELCFLEWPSQGTFCGAWAHRECARKTDLDIPEPARRMDYVTFEVSLDYHSEVLVHWRHPQHPQALRLQARLHQSHSIGEECG